MVTVTDRSERTRLVVALVWLATSYIDLEQNCEI